MTSGRLHLVAAVSMAWILVATIGNAQQTVYKWVDEDGVVHFGESPPAGVDAETITTQAGPRQDTQPMAPAAPAAASPADVPPPNQAPVPVEPAPAVTPVAEMSLAELDARCDAAREAKIAPLREAEIERCKGQPRSDPAFCERHNADFGEGGRTVNGTIRPRMFDDLPECVEALQERNRRRN